MAKNNTPVDKNSREYLLRQVANGRYSLLLIVILTVVNLIMTILDTNTYFLFSASVPYYLVFVGMGIENGFVDGAWNVKGTLTYTGLVIALVIVAVYLLCWLLSKKRAGWLTAALVLFIASLLHAPMEALLKGIAYFFGAAAYFCEIVLLTDCFTQKVPHREMFMAYCFGPMYILLGISYLFH